MREKKVWVLKQHQSSIEEYRHGKIIGLFETKEECKRAYDNLNDEYAYGYDFKEEDIMDGHVDDFHYYEMEQMKVFKKAPSFWV